MDRRSFLFVLALSAGMFFVNQWLAPSPEEKAAKAAQQVVAQAPKEEPPAPIQRPSEETLYVLSNEVQQIVFSTTGGAISEINLPFRTNTDDDSLVKPIAFDREMKEDHPENAYFPEASFYAFENGSTKKISEGSLGGYYPLLRRDVIGNNGRVLHPFSARHYAFNVISEDEPLHMGTYSVTRFEKDLIEMTYSDSYRKIIKTYKLGGEETPYCLDVEVRVEGDARGLWMTTGVPEVELISGNFSPNLKYLMQRGGKFHVESLSLPKSSAAYPSISPRWISNSNGFFGVIVEPLSDNGAGMKANMLSGENAPTKISLIDAEYDLYPVNKYSGYELLLPLKPLSSAPMKFRVFAGPYQDSLLKGLDNTFGETERNPNFSSAMSFQGWFTFISEPFGKFLFLLMKFFYKLTHSWGFSIILLTFALRLMLYPLNNWSVRSTMKMQEIAPQVSAIQKKYPKDPKRAQMEVVALYREKNVNPLSGCLPILIQLPFLIGMFDLLKSAFELRGAVFIPGWINNLTAPDVLFSWNYPVIFFGTSFHLLPVVLGLLMFVQQKISSQAPKDPSLMTDSQKQQKMMGNIMMVVFSVMFYHLPSGLNIYWLFSTLLGILQQWFAKKNLQGKQARKA